MSPCPCGPTPMQPTVIRLPGETVPPRPRADEETNEGTTAADRANPAVCFRNLRRVGSDGFIAESCLRCLQMRHAAARGVASLTQQAEMRKSKTNAKVAAGASDSEPACGPRQGNRGIGITSTSVASRRPSKNALVGDSPMLQTHS